MSVGSWKTKEMSSGAAWPQAMLPELSGDRPAIIRRAVLLPQPEGPRKLTNSWLPTVKLMPCSASVPLP